jgi:hypothetical protein
VRTSGRNRWAMTSPASTSTQSERSRPSTAGALRPLALSFSRRWVAIAATCRVDRPVAITKWSAIEDLPIREIVTTSSALSSSSEARMSLRSASLGTAVGLAFPGLGAFVAGLAFPTLMAGVLTGLAGERLAGETLVALERGVVVRTMTSPHRFGMERIPRLNIGMDRGMVNGTQATVESCRTRRRPARIAVDDAGWSWVWKNTHAGGFTRASCAARLVCSR